MAKKAGLTREKLNELRTKISESIRVQRGGGGTVKYVDPGTALIDIAARHNHVIFARRGSGKTLLLDQTALGLPKHIRHVYLNCEDFKRHSFPNVLIEIVDAVFAELQARFSGWFGKGKRAKQAIQSIRRDLAVLRTEEDVQDTDVKESSTSESELSSKGSVTVSKLLDIGATASDKVSHAIALEYKLRHSKVQKLDLMLPAIKNQIRSLFENSQKVKSVYIFMDDYYFLQSLDQPFIIDYIHRLCKDTPLFFKVATLRNASTLYIEHDRQPTGAQERHDFLPISIEFGLKDISQTERFIRKIFHEYGKLADIQATEIDDLFMGNGFSRLVLAAGGVPRDALALFLDALSGTPLPIGKDAVRELCRGNLDRRIEELKKEAHQDEQPLLLKGIYAIREFCLEDKKVNSFVVEEKEIQEKKAFKAHLDRLLDYRLIHELGTAFTHKSQAGTYRGYIIDVGFYAGLRKLDGKIAELDLESDAWKERIRSSPVLRHADMLKAWNNAPSTPTETLRLLAARDDTNGTD
jgi:hypothetical protein